MWEKIVKIRVLAAGVGIHGDIAVGIPAASA